MKKKDNNVLTKQKQIIIEHYLRSEEAKNMLSIFEAMIINTLSSFMGKKNECFPHQKSLARSCYMSERALRTALKSLEKHGIIRMKRGKNSITYSFNEFWLSEVDKYNTYAQAVDNLHRQDVPVRSAGRAVTSINNINNNKPSYQESKTYEPAKSGKVADWVKECLKH